MGIKFIIDRRENNKAYGQLNWPEKNLSDRAVSGPYGRGELPDGLYHAPKSGLIEPQEPGFCDSLNFCWFQYIEPQFSTPRTGLGIHPDGGIYVGTKGCIGLIPSDTKSWYDAFNSVGSSDHTTVEVIDNTKNQKV